MPRFPILIALLLCFFSVALAADCPDGLCTLPPEATIPADALPTFTLTSDLKPDTPKPRVRPYSASGIRGDRPQRRFSFR